MFEDLGSIPDSTKTALCGVISVHQDAFRGHFVDETTAISHSVLTDFDWQLKVRKTVVCADKSWPLESKLNEVILYVVS